MDRGLLIPLLLLCFFETPVLSSSELASGVGVSRMFVSAERSALGVEQGSDSDISVVALRCPNVGNGDERLCH